MIGAALAGGALLAGSGIIGSAIGARASDKASQRAADAQKEVNAANIAFQERENAIAREREDNAHQREVADLRAAGLSPLANTTGASAQSMSAPVEGAEGFMQSAQFDAQKGQQLAQMANAPANGFMQALSNLNMLSRMQADNSLANAQQANVESATTAQDINNSFLAFRNASELLKMSEEIQNLRVNTEEKKIWNERLGDYIDSMLSNNFASASANNARAANILGEERRHEATFRQQKELNIPYGTATSLNLSGPFNVNGMARDWTNLAFGVGKNAPAFSPKDFFKGSIFGQADALQKKIMDGLQLQTKESVQQMELVNAQNELGDLYRSGSISYDEYVKSMKSLWRENDN